MTRRPPRATAMVLAYDRARRGLVAVLDPFERTMLVVTHDLPLAAQLCDRAVILAGGRVVADGRCRDLLADVRLLADHDLELPAGFELSRLAPSADVTA